MNGVFKASSIALRKRTFKVAIQRQITRTRFSARIKLLRFLQSIQTLNKSSLSLKHSKLHIHQPSPATMYKARTMTIRFDLTSTAPSSPLKVSSYCHYHHNRSNTYNPYCMQKPMAPGQYQSIHLRPSYCFLPLTADWKKTTATQFIQ